MGTALGPHVSGADNSSTDLTDEDVSSVDDGDEADGDDDDEDGDGNLVADDEHYEDTKEVIDSFQSSKRERSTGSSSDSCDDSSHQLRKRGKQIGKQLLNLASTLPLPADDNDATQEPTLDNPNKPDNDVDFISSSQANDFTDYLFTQATPKPKSKTVLSDSQSASSGPVMFLSEKPTLPSLVLVVYISLNLCHGGIPLFITVPFISYCLFMATTMEIVTFDCQGLWSFDHRETLFSWSNCTNVDFLCLQETHSVSQREFSSWLKDAKEANVLSKSYDCVSSPGTNRSCGVAIVYKSKFELSTCAIDQKGRFVCGHFSTDHNSFQLCTAYGPNTSKDGGPFFDTLYPVLETWDTLYPLRRFQYSGWCLYGSERL